MSLNLTPTVGRAVLFANLVRNNATPLTGVMIGTGISLFLWAMILAVVFAVR